MSASQSTEPGDQYLAGLFMFLYRTIREHLFLTVLLPLVATAIAYFAALQLPNIYTAQGSIRIGKVDGGEAMSIAGVVSRINSLSFKQRVAQRIGLPLADGQEPARLILGSMAAKQETSDTVAVSVRTTTGQQARDALATVVGLLNEEQGKTRGPLEADVKEQVATYDVIIAGLLANKDSLSALAKEDLKDGYGDSASTALRRVWLSDLVSRNEQWLASARAERHALSARLSPWRTYPTVLVDEALVSRGFAFGRPVVIAFLAGGAVFLIFLLGILLRGSKPVRPDQERRGLPVTTVTGDPKH